MVSRFRFVLGQLGAKPGARQALSLLLDAADLEAAAAAGSAPPQRWRRVDQRSWRTGEVPSPEPWQAAARAARSITAWRSLQAGPRPQWLWVQWSPMACADDASSALTAAEDIASNLPNRGAAVDIVSQQRVSRPPAVAGADQLSATEQQTTGAHPVLLLRCTAGRHLVLLCASGDGWTWPSLAALAQLQLQRLPTRE